MTDTLLTREVEAIPAPAPRSGSRTLRDGLIIGGAAPAVAAAAAIGTASTGSEDDAPPVHSTSVVFCKHCVMHKGHS